MYDFNANDKKKFDEGYAIGVQISDALNHGGMSGSAKIMEGIVEAFRKSHRSLQYDEIILLVKAFDMFAECGTDERNENAVNLAKYVKAKIEEKYGDIKYIN